MNKRRCKSLRTNWSSILSGFGRTTHKNRLCVFLKPASQVTHTSSIRWMRSKRANVLLKVTEEKNTHVEWTTYNTIDFDKYSTSTNDDAYIKKNLFNIINSGFEKEICKCGYFSIVTLCSIRHLVVYWMALWFNSDSFVVWGLLSTLLSKYVPICVVDCDRIRLHFVRFYSSSSLFFFWISR